MTGLCDRIRTAPSKEAVEALVSEGKGFHFASGATRRRWGRLAAKRIAALSAPPPKQAAAKKEGK